MNIWNALTIVCLLIAVLLCVRVIVGHQTQRFALSRHHQNENIALGIVFIMAAAAIHWRSLIGSSAESHPLKAWIILGCVSSGIAMLSYFLIYRSSRTFFIGRHWRDIISDLISHVPNEKDPALPHILAGVFACLGICLLLGVLVASLLSGNQNVNSHNIALTTGALVFAVLISTVSFWTLYQTKRIEEMQGSLINSFQALIIGITEQIKLVNADFQSHNFNAREYHRVLIVTTNPRFGLLSFPDKEFTRDFAHAMQDAADNVKISRRGNADNKFMLEILCGDEETLNQFHQTFYKATDVGDNRVKDATDATKDFIDDLGHRALGKPGHDGIVFEVNEILKTQFAVVGNVVFEFMMETPGLQTEIHQTRRIREKVVCDRFRDLFDLLKQLSEHNHRAVPPEPEPPVQQNQSAEILASQTEH